MTFNWGDSFDLYTAVADMATGYWDSQSGGAFVAGRFTGRALSFTAGGNLIIKSSAVNDNVHHVAVSFQQTAAISGTTLGNYIAFFDGANSQCCVVFKSNGDIVLTQGNVLGTVLDTFSGVITASNLWGGYEFEVVIHNTAGSWAVRINGNTVNDHALGGLNTRGGSTNNYANKLQFGQNATVNSQQFDDVYWQSGSATGNWLGDLRCYTRMPTSDNSIQFTKGPHSVVLSGNSGPLAVTANRSVYSPFTPAVNGTIGTVTLIMSAGFTGNLKCSIFAAIAGPQAGATVGSPANVLVNPATGANTITFPTPVPVTEGTQYMIGVCPDTTSGNYGGNAGAGAQFSTAVSYASFPVSTPANGGSTSIVALTANITPTDNYSAVNEAQQDAGASYNYDSTVNDADFYGSAAVSGVTTIACITRAYMTKNDAGLRSGAVQLKSGGTTVTSPTVVLLNSGFLWAYRLDLVDPATSVAWTAAGVNAALIGPTVIA